MVDTAIAEVDARGRQLRQLAAERRMPTGGEEVDSVARAATEFEHAATQLHAERGKLAQAVEDLAERTETIIRHALGCAAANASVWDAGAVDPDLVRQLAQEVVLEPDGPG